MPSEETNSLEENKTIVQRLCEEVFNQANGDAAKEILSPTYTIVSPSGSLIGALRYELGTRETSIDPLGPEGAMTLIETLHDRYPDLQADIDHVAAEGSVVVSFFEIEARGGEEQQVAVEGIVANLISDGMIERSVASYEIVPLLSGRWRWPFRR